MKSKIPLILFLGFIMANLMSSTTMSKYDCSSAEKQPFATKSDPYPERIQNNERYTLFDVLGKKVDSGFVSQYGKLDLTKFSSGVYILKTKNKSRKIIINEPLKTKESGRQTLLLN